VSASTAMSLEAVLAELPAAETYAAAAGLSLDASTLSEEDLRFYVTFQNATGESFTAEIDCRDFPMYPPMIEFVDATSGARGLHSLYPSVFHPMPCVCARYNRKAYSERGGPHGDWRLVDWHLPTNGGAAADNLAMIISDLHSKISVSAGRLG
jgi:hypothetical protein